MQEGYFLKTSCGSFNYAAPEVIKGARYAGPEVDVWSSGVVLFALLCGVLPFNDDMQQGIPYVLRKILAGNYSIPHFVSPQAQDLISRMLRVDPLQRITVTEIKCVYKSSSGTHHQVHAGNTHGFAAICHAMSPWSTTTASQPTAALPKSTRPRSPKPRHSAFPERWSSNRCSTACAARQR